MLARKAQLERAKAHLQRLEKNWRPALNREASPLALAEGALHEIRIEDWRERAAAASFALTLAGRRAGALVFLQLAHEARADGALFARGLVSYGVEPARVIAVFARDEKLLLWALEEAAREQSVGTVIALAPRRGRLLDLTATRRLALAAESSRAAPILIRTIREAVPTAAAVRWKIASAPSRADPDDERAPGAPRWLVSLERFRVDGRQCAAAPFLVELRHDGRPCLAKVPQVPLPLSPLLGDGPAEAQNAFARDGRRTARAL